MCEILPKSEESFLEKLYINFKDSTLHSLKYFDSFDQIVELNFDRVIWLPFDESELLISVPEGIDVVYH
jgi:outer membrane lipoprotein-sorting protein